MSNQRSYLVLSVIVVAIFVMASVSSFMGCAGVQPSPPRPDWVDKGGGAFSGDWGKAFYAVGSISGIPSVSLREKSAEARARAALANVFKTRIADLTKVYERVVTGGIGPAQAQNLEGFAQAATTAFTAMELTGAQIVDRWYDRKNDTQYALTILDARAFKSQIERVKELREEAKNLIIENADKAFEELVQEAEKTR